jgi:hypothetical protein
MNERGVQLRFDAKATTALQDQNARSCQDWSGLQAILNRILATLSASLPIDS